MTGFDLTLFIATAQKNMRALSETQKLAFKQWQSLSTCNTRIFTEVIKGHTTIANEMFGENNPEEKIARQADIIGEICEASMQSLREIVSTTEISSKKACAILNEHLSGTLEDLEYSWSFEMPGEKAA